MNLLEARKKSDKKAFFKAFSSYIKKGFFSRKNLKRDLIIWATVLLIVGLYFGLEKYFSALTFDDIENSQEVVEKEVDPTVTVQSQINTENWKPYENSWYGFWLKYPENWNKPTSEKATGEVKWEQKIIFSFEEKNNENPFKGFEVLIYDTSKVKEISSTDEFPKLKNPELISKETCFVINDHLLETGDYSSKEIYIPAYDNCYHNTLFFTNARDKYIYNIIPSIKEGREIGGDYQQQLAKYMPEFFTIASTWKLIDINRPKPKPVIVKPKITAPMPVSYRKVNGLRVCAKKNDKPSKSKKNKGKHLDMECCLDPDEYPNPHCYYDPKKYGKYLK